MKTWQEALKIALIGTERQALSFTPSDEAVGRLLSELNPEERERTLLRASGLLAVYQRAGYRPQFATNPLPAPADAEEKPPVPEVVMQDLLVMMGGQYREALPDWLQAATERGWRVPEEHLSELLDFGRSHPESRAALLPLLGKRGRWIAAQNPDWKYALQFSLFEIESAPEIVTAETGDLEQLWQTGTKEERVALLHRLRHSDPASARALVESTWKQDAPAERTEFVATFATGLSMEDEPFLETMLDDKRKEARTTAQDLLARLPDSRLCRRMWERLRPLVQLQKVETSPEKPEMPENLWYRVRTLLTPKTAPTFSESIVVELPQACDKAMIRDGIEVKPQFSDVGEKTWWLTQMLERIPLTLWRREWHRTPTEILAANRSEEWQKTLLDAWTKALRREKDPEWATALFRVWYETLPDKMPLDDRWKEILPPDVYEVGLLHLLDHSGQRIQFGHPAFTLLERHKTVWSAPLTRRVLATLNAFTGNAYYISGKLSVYAPWIPADFRAEFFAIWSRLAENDSTIQNQIERHRALDAFCSEMRRKMDAPVENLFEEEN